MSLFDKLFLIPCCKTKAKNLGPHCESTASEPLEDLVSPAVYSGVLDARRNVLSRIMECNKYTSDKYEQNQHIRLGPDFGQQDESGLYLPASERYNGLLYAKAPTLSSGAHPDTQIIILSALYGPVHPTSYIQDYNLQMGDRPAYGVWKENFAPFLRCYVRSNGIREIHLFFGCSTSYSKVARAAVKPLLEEHVIRKAIQYHVKNGSSRVTPETHGKLLEQCLTQGRIGNLSENVQECVL